MGCERCGLEVKQVAANRSFVTNERVVIADLVQDIGYPDYAGMPSRNAKLPMPK